MAKVTIESNDGRLTAIIHISNKNGPWTDDDFLDEIAWEIDQALKLEGDEA